MVFYAVRCSLLAARCSLLILIYTHSALLYQSHMCLLAWSGLAWPGLITGGWNPRHNNICCECVPFYTFTTAGGRMRDDQQSKRANSFRIKCLVCVAMRSTAFICVSLLFHQSSSHLVSICQADMPSKTTSVRCFVLCHRTFFPASLFLLRFSLIRFFAVRSLVETCIFNEQRLQMIKLLLFHL